mmetsp:Transcript_11076/g.27938  ORF Transcript_11076/g.27938 Transcript_11076/m.27938 type:complete len:302 (+) Transcript_11076:124-1029(+)
MQKSISTLCKLSGDEDNDDCEVEEEPHLHDIATLRRCFQLCCVELETKPWFMSLDDTVKAIEPIFRIAASWNLHQSLRNEARDLLSAILAGVPEELWPELESKVATLALSVSPSLADHLNMMYFFACSLEDVFAIGVTLAFDLITFWSQRGDDLKAGDIPEVDGPLAHIVPNRRSVQYITSCLAALHIRNSSGPDAILPDFVWLGGIMDMAVVALRWSGNRLHAVPDPLGEAVTPTTADIFRALKRRLEEVRWVAGKSIDTPALAVRLKVGAAFRLITIFSGDEDVDGVKESRQRLRQVLL